MNDERIIKYIENELSSKEKIDFEAELNNSASLKTEFEIYLKVKLQTEELKKLKLNQIYLDSVVPEFREKVNISKSSAMRKNLGYAFGIMLIFIIAIYVLKDFLIDDTRMSDIHEFTQSLDQSQKIELLEKLDTRSEDIDLLPEIISGNELTELLSSGLVLNEEIVDAYDISNSELIVGLTQNEVDKIYTELLNKNF
jgi:hypothetical protein